MEIQPEIKEKDIVEIMEESDINPSKKLGQHILTDEKAIETFANNIERGGNVIEIGPGPGNITSKVADRAKKVVAIEIDRKFEPVLSQLQEDHKSVSVVYKDVLNLNLENLIKSDREGSGWQIISNLPFHITEPFFKQIIDLPITDAVLILGKQVVDRMQIEDPNDEDFSRTGLIVQTFFEYSILMRLPSSYFYPEPGTDSAMVVLTPRNKAEYKTNKKLSILRHLFLTESKHSPIGKMIKAAYGRVDDDVIRDKKERNRYDRRQTRQELKHVMYGVVSSSDDELPEYDDASRLFDRIDLSEDILNQPFSALDNQDLKDLVKALNKL